MSYWYCKGCGILQEQSGLMPPYIALKHHDRTVPDGSAPVGYRTVECPGPVVELIERPVVRAPADRAVLVAAGLDWIITSHRGLVMEMLRALGITVLEDHPDG